MTFFAFVVQKVNIFLAYRTKTARENSCTVYKIIIFFHQVQFLFLWSSQIPYNTIRTSFVQITWQEFFGAFQNKTSIAYDIARILLHLPPITLNMTDHPAINTMQQMEITQNFGTDIQRKKLLANHLLAIVQSEIRR